MSVAILKKSHLNTYNVIPGPGTFKVKVLSTVKPEYIYDEGSKARYIVNLRAATVEGFEKCLEIMDIDEWVPFVEVRGCFMSGVIWDNDLSDYESLPIKGEEVIVTFDYVEDVLRCTSLTLIPRKKLTTFKINDMCKNRRLFKEILKE